MALRTMKDLLIDQLNELYAGEKHSAKILPTLAEVASSRELAEALRRHAAETEEHVTRLEGVFDAVGVRPRAVESRGMKGLLEDCVKLAHSTRAEPHVRDAAMIAVAQHVEHDEIAGYGCARTWARLLGLNDAADQLQATLKEERRSDTDLSRVAETLNQAAMSATPA